MLSDDVSAQDRVISLGPGLAAIPERLLIAHARGEVLFICGAGVSMPAGLPDFRTLVVQVYEELDPSVHAVISNIPRSACNMWEVDFSNLNEPQRAEVKRFIWGDFDVVLGMLERRLDGQARGDSRVRNSVSQCLRRVPSQPAEIHRSLIKLADRGGVSTIATTNFDLLLEGAGGSANSALQTYALGSIPRPTRQAEFSGVLHIHGALERKSNRTSELVLSDQDFGEFYLRRRVVPDFIYDAARLFNLVLVGYSANDPPMRYLLNAVAADGTRFDDLKERFTFFGTNTPDPVALEDWKARGITPIHYDANNGHAILRDTLKAWARLSAVNGSRQQVDAVIRRVVKKPRAAATDESRDLFDHIIRRSNQAERVRLAKLASDVGADHEWLDAVLGIFSEKESDRR